MATTTAVMGAGAWGTALAKLLADAGGEVTLWARRSDVADNINSSRYNPGYLPGVQLPAGIRATADPAEALHGVTTVLLAVPAQTMRSNLEQWTSLITKGATLVSTAKGIELVTLMRMSQVIVDVTGVDPSQVAVISGPNLASEITAGHPAATVIACSDSGRAVAVQRMLNAGYFRPYTNADVIGTEIGGAGKNVIALAVLAGVGDLVATCTSPRSRNRSFGESLGRGETLESALRERGGHVVEGVTSGEAVLALASSYDVEMPLTDAVERVCHKGLSVDQAVVALLGRSTKPE